MGDSTLAALRRHSPICRHPRGEIAFPTSAARSSRLYGCRPVAWATFVSSFKGAGCLHVGACCFWPHGALPSIGGNATEQRSAGGLGAK
jgi:hypothetical protein